MDGFKKTVKGGTLEFGIKVPPFPNDVTYVSTTEACFKSPRFPIENVKRDQYIKIESNHFGLKQKQHIIAETTLIERGSPYSFHLPKT